MVTRMNTDTNDELMRLRYSDVLAFVLSYANGHGDEVPYDANGVIHLMLAAFDNLREHWLDSDVDQLRETMTAEQRRDFVRIGQLLDLPKSKRT